MEYFDTLFKHVFGYILALSYFLAIMLFYIIVFSLVTSYFIVW